LVLREERTPFLLSGGRRNQRILREDESGRFKKVESFRFDFLMFS
jgi:hypothetical protein